MIENIIIATILVTSCKPAHFLSRGHSVEIAKFNAQYSKILQHEIKVKNATVTFKNKITTHALTLYHCAPSVAHIDPKCHSWAVPVCKRKEDRPGCPHYQSCRCASTGSCTWVRTQQQVAQRTGEGSAVGCQLCCGIAGQENRWQTIPQMCCQ